MRWPWSKKVAEKRPTRSDFHLPEMSVHGACKKCGARPRLGFEVEFHMPWNQARGHQLRCCFIASGRLAGEKFYLEHISRRCERCGCRWPERPLDWETV